jgi:hypothetical protein
MNTKAGYHAESLLSQPGERRLGHGFWLALKTGHTVLSIFFVSRLDSFDRKSRIVSLWTHQVSLSLLFFSLWFCFFPALFFRFNERTLKTEMRIHIWTVERAN